jgi:putative salt-induced outer membrane protein YdiY
MKPSRHSLMVLKTLPVLALVLAVPAWAQDEEEKKLGWTDAAELTFVATAGNAEAVTLGFRNTLIRTWEAATLTIDAGGLRAETTTLDRLAVGEEDSFEVREESDKALTAENYYLRGRYDRVLSDRLFWYAGIGWERNEFSGFRNRYHGVGGVGHLWFDNDRGHFRTDYGLTYTQQDDVVEDPTVSDSFLGLRLGADYLRQLTGTTTFGSLLLMDFNLDETSDYRADWTNWLAVSMSERMALKVSLQLLYDNEPSLTAVPLLGPDREPTDTFVSVPLDDLDSILTVALVVSF